MLKFYPHVQMIKNMHNTPRCPGIPLQRLQIQQNSIWTTKMFCLASKVFFLIWIYLCETCTLQFSLCPNSLISLHPAQSNHVCYLLNPNSNFSLKPLPYIIICITKVILKFLSFEISLWNSILYFNTFVLELDIFPSLSIFLIWGLALN